MSDTLTGAAKAEYAAARILYEDGDYSGALTKLEVAYRLSEDPRLLWNMAAAEKNQRHYARVIDLVGRFLESDSPMITPAERQQAQALLDTVRGFVSEVGFDIQPLGASVIVDGIELGKAPLAAPVPLDFGRRALRVQLAGYAPHEQALELEGGKPASVTVRLVRQPTVGTLRVVSDPKTTIRIDGIVMSVGFWQGPLPAGAHAVQLEAKGKVPQTTEVAIQQGETRTVNIQLRDATQHQMRAGVPAWVWVSGGVAVALLGGVSAYFLFRDEEESTSGAQGTWGTFEL